MTGNGTLKSRHDQPDWEAGGWLPDTKAPRRNSPLDFIEKKNRF
jgi:hypothetical protein